MYAQPNSLAYIGIASAAPLANLDVEIPNALPINDPLSSSTLATTTLVVIDPYLITLTLTLILAYVLVATIIKKA